MRNPLKVIATVGLVLGGVFGIAAHASVVRGPSQLHGIDPFETALREQKWVAEVKAIIGK